MYNVIIIITHIVGAPLTEPIIPYRYILYLAERRKVYSIYVSIAVSGYGTRKRNEAVAVILLTTLTHNSHLVEAPG